MIAKSLIAAAALAGSVLAVASTEASAKTNWDIHIGLGAPLYDVPVYDEPVYVAPSYSYDYYEPAPRRFREHRYVSRSYSNYGISCNSGRRMLRSEGFHDVEAYDCSAPTYGYSAWRDGGLFKVRLNLNGDIISVRQID